MGLESRGNPAHRKPLNKCTVACCLPQRFLPSLFVLWIFLCVHCRTEDAAAGEDSTCAEHLFQCETEWEEGQRCISKMWECDGQKDCPDGSDEHSGCAPVTCGSQKFQCDDNSGCVSLGWLCDGDRDCVDGSDEDPRLCEKTKAKMLTKVPSYKNSGEDEEFVCPPNQYLCRGTRKCLSMSQLCNSVQECPDADDETAACWSGDCQENPCICGDPCPGAKRCKPTPNMPNGYMCDCGVNAQWQNGACRKLNACLYDGTCDQLCDNSGPHPICDCVEGYQLASDDIGCVGINDPSNKVTRLAWAEENQLTIADIVDGDTIKTYKVFNISALRSFDYEFTNNSICYLAEDEKEAAFMECRNYEDSDIPAWQLPITNMLTSTTQVAFDWISQNWYFLDKTRKKIFVCSFYQQTSHCLNLIYHQLEGPTSMALDPVKGYIFFSNHRNNPKVERAMLNGAGREVLISSRQIVIPETLTLDYANEHVYWADSYLDRVERFNYDGTNRVLIWRKSWVENLAGLSIFQNVIYATRQLNNSIVSVHRFHAHDQWHELQIHLDIPSTITVLHQQRQPRPKKKKVPTATLR